jgi:putative salt-induced outer membrane protein
MCKKLTISMISALMLSTFAIADGEIKQNINVGFANTSGNTDTLNLNAKYDLGFKTTGLQGQELRTLFDASAFLAENNNVKDNEEYRANLGLEQSLGDGWLGYGQANWLSNEFRNYDSKTSIGAGIGKDLFRTDKEYFTVKLGGAYNNEVYTNNAPSKDFASTNEYLEYGNAINPTSKLYAKVGSAQNVDDFSNDYEVFGTAGLNFALAENLSVTIEEDVRYDALPSAGFKKTDTKSIVRFGYGF